MSIKAKLSFIISGTLLVIMFFNMMLNYFSTKENLRLDSEEKMMLAAKQIAIAIEQAHFGADYIERILEEKLRLAAVYAAKELDPDINKIANEQLVRLSETLGISHIALFETRPGGIVVRRSSNPDDLTSAPQGNFPKELETWFATNQGEAGEEQKQEQFWSGPIKISDANSNSVDKWGFYYDGQRNYVIDPYIKGREIEDFSKLSDMDETVKQTIEANPHILEIAGIRPEQFIEEARSAQDEGRSFEGKTNGSIAFGTYTYADREYDIRNVEKARQGEAVFYQTKLGGLQVIKSFIPVPQDPSYLISIVMDYKMISSVLGEQLINNIAISIVLLEITIIGSYFLSGMIIRPLHAILDKVNEVADGHFGSRLKIKSKDELGLLAKRINTMTHNLSRYTNQLQQSYEENRAMKDQLESFINQTSDAIHVVDLEGRVIRANKAFEQLFGWSADEVLGTVPAIVPESHREEEEQAAKWIASGKPLVAHETVRIAKSGQLLDVSVSTSPIYDENGNCTAYASITRDITGNKKMEELLRRSEKLTTVGQLAAGVAHEIRNPLTTLRGFLQFQQQTRTLNLQHTDLMLSELDRINLIVSEFLILAKPQATQFQKKDVRYILGDVISLLDSQAHLFNIEFVTRFTFAPSVIECEENHLKQVFINILKNAFEAMPGGGTIVLQLMIVDQDQVCIRIIDQGHGIPEDKISLLGQPFYTDKETGTGLGLMVSQRIIQSHKGTMEITSVVNEGTTVTITLPLAREEAKEDYLKEKAGSGRLTV